MRTPPPKRKVSAGELSQPLLSFESARERVLSGVAALAPRPVKVGEALGLVLAEEIRSAIDVPGFDSSAMDGYAVVPGDIAGASPEAPVTLPVAGEVPAGAAGPVLEPGTATKIMTGAPVPPGAGAVVPWEDCIEEGGAVSFTMPAAAGAHIRPRGEDVAAGQLVLAPGVELGPVHLGVASSLGLAEVLAFPRPRVSILSTGDELAAPGEPLRYGQVYDSNLTVLAAMLGAAGGEISMTARLGDDPAAVSGWLAEAASASDLIVSSGGASVGEHDWMREVLSSLGRIELWKVAMKPGKPFAFGRIGEVPVLAMPGNPGSALACAHAYGIPVLRKLSGRSPAGPCVRARLGAAVAGSPNRTLLCRVRLEGGLARPLPEASSVVLSNLIGVDGFALVAPGGLAEGAEVVVELLARQ